LKVYLCQTQTTMLQRIQSVWLFFATAAIFCLFLFPYLQVLGADGTAKALKVTGIYQSIGGQTVQTEAFLALTIATVIVGLIPFVVIFLYKDRKKQLVFCYAGILCIIGYSLWLFTSGKDVLNNITLQPENYGIGSILPSVAILFMILAIRGIRKDDRLIKSAERLR
jgi:hypothetical protein